MKIYEVDEPASFARALLIEALRRRGVRVASSPLDVNVDRKSALALRGGQITESGRIHLTPF